MEQARETMVEGSPVPPPRLLMAYVSSPMESGRLAVWAVSGMWLIKAWIAALDEISLSASFVNISVLTITLVVACLTRAVHRSLTSREVIVV